MTCACYNEARSAPRLLPRSAAKGRQTSGASGGDIWGQKMEAGA